LLPTFWSAWIRADLYRRIGFTIGSGSAIMGNMRLIGTSSSFYENLVVGSGAEISDSVTINLDERVSLGNNVALGPGVTIYTASHKIGPGSHRLGKVVGLPVTIEDGVWVRLGAVIAPGVTVGRGSIVALGAVVLQDVPPNTYVEGNPAKVTRKLGWGDR
jgi:maltose O-acetyltransferase